MPHVNSSGGDDLASTDEVKVYKDEGEEEKRSSENLSEDKLGLVTETEEDKNSDLSNNYPGGDKSSGAGQDGKNDQGLSERLGLPGGYLFAPYAYANGASLGGKMPLQPPHPGALSPLMMYNSEHLTQPPPAHMGIPPVHIDPKTGLPRHPMYAIPPPPGQFHHPLYSPEFSQMQWSSPPGYPITTSGLRNPYPTSLSSLSRFSPPGMLHHPGMHPGLNHPAIITPGPKQEINSENHRHISVLDHSGHCVDENGIQDKKRPYVKKPLNAFMLFMKEQRAKVVLEGTLKESAAINQILGRKWHALDRSEQAKYYEMARKEKELHMQLYPGWSARDNYAANSKKKKRKREPSVSTPGSQDCTTAKKCRARFGVEAQNQWCKPCRRKKKCERFKGGDDDSDDDETGSMTATNSVVDSTTTECESEYGSPAPSSMSISETESQTSQPQDSVQHSTVSSVTSSSRDDFRIKHGSSTPHAEKRKASSPVSPRPRSTHSPDSVSMLTPSHTVLAS